MQTKRDFLSIGKASIYLGISIDTLRRWEKSGKLTTYRSPGGHRYFERKVLDNLFGSKYERYNLQNIKKSDEVKDNDNNLKVNKSPETSVEKTAEKPKLQVPRYIQTQRISKYDILLHNASSVVSPETSNATSITQNYSSQINEGFSILEPKNTETIATKSLEEESTLPTSQKKEVFISSKLIIIIASLIAFLIIVILLILNSSPKVLSPIP